MRERSISEQSNLVPQTLMERLKQPIGISILSELCVKSALTQIYKVYTVNVLLSHNAVCKGNGAATDTKYINNKLRMPVNLKNQKYI